ncbi:sigma factor-like helix-turn-helix DNA-binding protein [Paenibacillus sp. FSL H7-0326]
MIERVPSLTQHEIASRVNVSQSRVSQILKIIKKK